MAVRGLVGMVCLGVGLAIFLSGRACQAGCGDYVFVRNASGQLVRASSLMKDHDSPCTGSHCPDAIRQVAEGLLPASPAESLPIKLPCNGPNCSERSEFPAAPSPPPAPQRSVQESTALPFNLNAGDQAAGARFNSAPSNHDHELHYPQSIFHPLCI